jgi:hypothetical protein
MCHGRHASLPTKPCDVSCGTRSVRDMAPEDAEQRLIEWVTVTRDRDTRARAAVEAGLSKHGCTGSPALAGRRSIASSLALLPLSVPRLCQMGP